MKNINDFTIGQTEKISKLFTKADVVQFSELSLDVNPVHLDDEYAKTTFFKKVIVHGFLYGSLISATIANKLPGPGAIYLHQELNFKLPVYLNEEVTAVVRVTNINKEKSLLYLETMCFKDTDKIVIEGKAVIKLL